MRTTDDNGIPETVAREGRLATFVFWLAASILLFHNLGVDPLRGSEERWAEIVRAMLLTGDWFHPAINGQIYFDKPLLSYWPIAALSLLMGHVDELVIRLPGAASALAVLWCTRRLGALLLSQWVGVFAGWLMLTCLGFVSVARTASADMMNLAAVTAAVWWFFRSRDQAGFWSYLVFYIICFGGALAKGLPALIIPPVLVFSYLLMDGTWRTHLRLAHAVAALAGFVLFLVPFEIAAHTPIPDGFSTQDSGLTGLELVWRENIVRVFRPFDHKEPFYSYFIHVPRIMAPWSALVFVAAAALARRWKSLSPNARWLLVAFAVIFLMFTLSGSRRWYYIMPIVPFAALLMSEYLIDPRSAWRNGMAAAYEKFMFVVGILCVLFPFCLPALARSNRLGTLRDIATLPASIILGIPATAVLGLAVFYCGRERMARVFAPLGLPGRWGPIVLFAFIMLTAGMTIAAPEAGALRQEKAFGLRLREKLRKFPDAEVVFYDDANPKLSFYMDLLPPTPMLPTPETLATYLARADREVFVIADDRNKTEAELAKAIPGFTEREPFLLEAKRPFDHPGRERIACWLFPVRRDMGLVAVP